jgi:hypothetical protein
MNIHMNIE